jgi:tRNA/rRNA methyltransferase
VYNTPVIILVAPQLAENIGSVARVMSNFDFEDLRIVSPRDGWPPSEIAHSMAAKGSYILDNAVVYDDIESASYDLNFLVAMTARSRYMEKIVKTPKDIVKYCEDNSATKVGFLFGRENNGLTNEELGYADMLSVISTSEKNKSLNLAQAVSIVAYEFYNNINILGSNKENTLSTKGHFVQFFNKFIHLLESKEYFPNSEIKETMIQNLKNTFVKSQLTTQEVNTLMGIVKLLSKN